MKRYEKYKNSGIEWLGEIPEHWEVKRVKDILANTKYAIKTGPFGSQLKGTDLKDEGIKCVYSQRNVIDNQFDSFKYFIDQNKANELSAFNVRPNDILITTRGTIGKASVIPNNCEPGILHPCLIALRTNNKIINCKLFLYYLNDSGVFQKYIAVESNATTIEVIYSNTMNVFLQVLPPMVEQTAIANYLDTKTATIDRKIELLTAKADKYKALRRSLINETVCRGLPRSEGFSPNEALTKFKDSGIEWIGMIPEHWEVKRVKDVFKYTTGGTPDTKNELYYDGDKTWICIGDISDEKYISESKLHISNQAVNDLGMIKTPKGSLLYSFKLSIGKMAFVEKDVYTNEAILSIFPNKNISLHYIYYMLPYFLEIAATENIYGAKMLNQKLIANAFLTMPNLKEQTVIATFLDDKTTQINTILTNIGEQINKLTQLRKTLINDVVTGKIKVTE